MKPAAFFAVVLGAAVLAAPAAWAHHSVAMYDVNKTQVITGVVTEVRLVNPHAYILVTAPDPQTGKDVVWKLEGKGVYLLAQQGIVPGVLKPGDKITLTGHPMRDGSVGGTFDKFTLNGQTYGQ